MITNDVYVFRHPIDDILRKDLYRKILEIHKNYVYGEDENNIPLHGKFAEHIKNVFVEKCVQIFNFEQILNDDRNTPAWAYVVSKDWFKFENIHNHLNTSTYVGVYYLNVPETTNKFDGCLKFFDWNLNVVDHFFPKTDDFIIFNSDLRHSITKPSTEEFRISINVELKVSKKINFISNIA